jgi:hypothetical protein
MFGTQLWMQVFAWFMARGIAPNQISITTALVALVSYFAVPIVRSLMVYAFGPAKHSVLVAANSKATGSPPTLKSQN